ncbi:MAG: hypothetical protein OWQ57_08485 [Sulfobacillus sp.]|nr:hypothetical protein [Sulfobacillus sp.]
MMTTILPPSELMVRLRRMSKEEVKALRDAALDVAKGSRHPLLPGTADLVLRQIRVLYPDLG